LKICPQTENSSQDIAAHVPRFLEPFSLHHTPSVEPASVVQAPLDPQRTGKSLSVQDQLATSIQGMDSAPKPNTQRLERESHRKSQPSNPTLQKSPSTTRDTLVDFSWHRSQFCHKFEALRHVSIEAHSITKLFLRCQHNDIRPLLDTGHSLVSYRPNTTQWTSI
jgi:hypothetical protein